MKPSPRSLRQLAGHRELIFEMARREFAERYLGQFFGTLWQLLHPVTFIAIYIVIFAGEDGRTLMRAALADRGARVTVAACYRRVVPDVSTTDVEHRLRTGTLDAVTATSSEGLRNLLTIDRKGVV